MSDQGSTYAVLQNVPVMVSPLYNLPKKIFIASELKIVPEDVKKLPAYPFSVEREAIAQVESARKLLFEEEEAFNIKKKKYEEEKALQQKAAARRIAPGFLDSDTRILQPQQTYKYLLSDDTEDTSGTESPTLHSLRPTVNSPPKETVTSSPLENNPEKQLNYLEFEQGLAPADPWDTPENDMAALRSILGSPKSNIETRQPSQYSPQYPQVPPNQLPRPYQKNEGVYWNFNNNYSSNVNMNGGGYPSSQLLQRQHQQSSHSFPALPPKLFNNPPLPTSSTSSPIIPPPTVPPPGDYHKKSNISVTPPPLPPLPVSQPALPNENLITELGNMGFTRAQAIDALEKNDFDLIKATNFLLDQA